MLTEKIELVIWDLDETFWSGTLEEGGALLIPEHLAIVRTLSDRGIISSIASKNNFERARFVLEAAGLWDHFVFPQIAFQPKGALIRKVIQECQLRAPSVLFIDDNPANLNEAVHYNPGIQVAEPSIIKSLLSEVFCEGSDDKSHSRLKQYKMLEQRALEKESFASDNADFLGNSKIRISFHTDVMAEFPRILELINRTNQMNYTKNRLPDDIIEARLIFERHLGEYGCGPVYIKVADKYGFHGISGFYMIRTCGGVDFFEHLLFSCRVMNMGVEQFVYKAAGSVGFEASGEVIGDPRSGPAVDWITIVRDAEINDDDDDAEVGDTEHGRTQTICIRGACELCQASHYLRQRFYLHEEFGFPYSGWSIYPQLADYATLRHAFENPDFKPLFSKPWIHPKLFESSVFQRSSDVYVLSFGTEPHVDRYVHKESGLVFPMQIHEIGTDLTQLSYRDIAGKVDKSLSEEDWTWFCREFRYEHRFNEAHFAKNLNRLVDNLHGKKIIFILQNSESGSAEETKGIHSEVDAVVERIAHQRGAAIIRLAELIKSSEEIVYQNHYSRAVYMRLAACIEGLIDSGSLKTMDLPTTESDRHLVLRTNLLNDDALSGMGWELLAGSTAMLFNDVTPPVQGAPVLRHELGNDVSWPHNAVMSYRLTGVSAGDVLVLSMWVLLPSTFSGTGVSTSFAGFACPTFRAAHLDKRGSWQRIWCCAEVPNGQTMASPSLTIIGKAGDVVFSSGWKVEHGRIPSDFRTETGPLPALAAE